MLVTRHTTHIVEQQLSGELLGLITILRDKQHKLCRYTQLYQRHIQTLTNKSCDVNNCVTFKPDPLGPRPSETADDT